MARQRGYRDLSAMMRNEVEPWKSKIPPADWDPDVLNGAHKLRQVIQPVLESGSRDLSAALIEYTRIFGEPITQRHLQNLVDRTAWRAGYGGDLHRLEIYLPERIKGRAAAHPAPEVSRFADLQSAARKANPSNPTTEDVASIRELAIRHFDRLINAGATKQQAGDRVREILWTEARFLISSSDQVRGRDALRKLFSRWLKRRAERGDAGDGRKKNGSDPNELTQRILALSWFIPDAKGFYLSTNRTKTSGSLPEAVRRTISQEKCPADLREMILTRQRAGKALVPESIARQIICSAAAMQFHRNPKEAALRYANASGGSKFTRAGGEYIPLRCGQRMIPDDGSINFCVCIPWDFPTTTSARKFGVLVGRFQLLLFVDALSYRICARSFVVRPKESYRTEDVLHLYNVFMQQEGIPDEIFHEGGVWNAGRVKDCLNALNIRRHLVTSPHAKQPVENRFNKLWTILSAIAPGQIGRYRGEMQTENELLRSCRAGATDPRKVFPMLSDAIRYIDQAIKEANSTPVDTDVGRWIPDELWAEQIAARPLGKLNPDDSFRFSPCCETRTVRNGVRVKFPLFEEWSAPFHFNASWLYEYEGAKVDVYFDPYGNSSHGTLVLRQAWNGRSTGSVLGRVEQTNDIASYARLMMSFGAGPNDDARKIRQQQISAMRSNRKAIAVKGPETVIDEVRDGLGSLSRFERGTAHPKKTPEEIAADRQAEESARQMRSRLLLDQTAEIERLHPELFY